jgi:hypothetical protein
MILTKLRINVFRTKVFRTNVFRTKDAGPARGRRELAGTLSSGGR